MIEVTLPYPPSANRYWRHRSLPRGGGIRTYISADGNKFRAAVHATLQSAGVRDPIKGRVKVTYRLFPNRPLDYKKRMRDMGEAWQDSVQCIDLDNAQKALMDSLKGVAFEDDAWVREIVAQRAEPDGKARIEVTIEAIEVDQPQLGLL